MDWTARVTQFWREWTAKQGIEAAEGWLELTPEKAREFAAAFASEVERETLERAAKSKPVPAAGEICKHCELEIFPDSAVDWARFGSPICAKNPDGHEPMHPV